MSKNIVVVQPKADVEAGGIRALVDKSTGSDNFSFQHAIFPTTRTSAKGIVYNGYDEGGYVIRGKCEISSGGKTEIVGPGGFFFVPDGVPYDFKVVEAPLEVIAVFSPPLPSDYFDQSH